MRSRIRSMALMTTLAGLVGAGLMGCGGSPQGETPTPEKMQAIALGDVAELYRMFTLDKKKPPQRMADLELFEQLNPTGVLAIRGGEVVVRWGATMTDLSKDGPADSGGDEVLAWLKEVPESGGMVLMLNREQKEMTAQEFKSAKLAGTSDSASPTTTKKK